MNSILNAESPVINPSSIWVMDCTNEKLLETCRKFLPIIDDLQQVCTPEYWPELEYTYSRIEMYYRNIKPASSLSVKYRNEIRLILKDVLKYCAIFNYSPETI